VAPTMKPADDVPITDLFRPAWGLRSGRIQTTMASSRFRIPARLQLETSERERIITTPDGVQLQGFLSIGDGGNRPLAVLFHGWEGTVRSAYMLRTGEALFREGFDVFRLHYRDHGDTQHLNREPFRSDGVQEVADAVRIAASWYPDRPVYLAGFSLGGSFALRVGRLVADRPIPNLRRIVAVSPLLNPAESTRVIDNIPWLRAYFLKKWFRSLRKKQAAWPDDYPIDDVYQMDRCMEITERLVSAYLPYPSVQDYFNSYTLTGDALRPIQVPTHIITAADDPVIPVSGFASLDLPETVHLTVSRYGGHCGFLLNWRTETWLTRHLADWFQTGVIPGSSG